MSGRYAPAWYALPAHAAVQWPDDVTLPAATAVYIGRDNAGDLTLNALTGKTVNLAVNAVDIAQLSATALTFPAAINIAVTGALTLTPTTDTLIANATGLVVGHTAQVTVSYGDGATAVTPEFQVLGSGNPDSFGLLGLFSADSDGPTLVFLKSRNAAIGSNTIVVNGDRLGRIVAMGADGTDFKAAAAAIEFRVDGTPGVGDMPGRIEFYTSADGAENPTLRLTMSAAGLMTWAAACTHTGFVATNSITLGVAGSALGTLNIAGNTSGTVSLTVAAAAGTWTMTLPPGANANAGYQLTCAAADSITSWAAAASLRELKDISGEHSPQDALDKILGTRVYDFHYKQGRGTQDQETAYVGVVADEAPWAMHYNGGVVNPINALGFTVLAFQAMQAEIDSLRAELAAVKAA